MCQWRSRAFRGKGVMRSGSLDADALEHLINHESGLKGLSDSNDDMQTLLQRSDADAELAIDIFCTAVRKTIGAYAALMGVSTGSRSREVSASRRRLWVNASALDSNFLMVRSR
jgi:acetate kinase